MKKLAFASALITLLMASACQFSADTGITPIPTTDVSLDYAQEAADDIVPTPGGPAYRANIHQQGVTNPWPPIESSEVIIGDNGNFTPIIYRDYIETRAGETRNNILHLQLPFMEFSPSGDYTDFLILYTGDIPNGIDVKEMMRWHGIGPSSVVLIIEVSQDVIPGEYTFEIGIEMSSSDYGTVPCTIKVIG